MASVELPYWQDERGVWHMNIYANAPIPLAAGGGRGININDLIPNIISVTGQPVNWYGLGGQGAGYGAGTSAPATAKTRGLLTLILVAVMAATLLATDGKLKVA